jgi:hypothetical protein
MEILIIAILIGLLPAYLARKKGRSFVLWWIYGALLFIVALPHALLMKPRPGSKDALEEDALKKAAGGFTPVRASPVDFIADGVIHGTPFHHEPEGSAVALVNGRTIRFKSVRDLELMLLAGGQQSS